MGVLAHRGSRPGSLRQRGGRCGPGSGPVATDPAGQDTLTAMLDGTGLLAGVAVLSALEG